MHVDITRARKRWARFSLAVFLLALLGSRLAGELVAASGITRKACRIAQNGQVDTDLPFSRFFNDSFTLSAWVMPEFTYNWNGAIFTVNGQRGSGTFRVGQGDYRMGNGGYLLAGDPVLEVELNGKIVRYLAPGYKRRQWNHIAVVRANVLYAGPMLQLYLNGQKLSPYNATLDILLSQSSGPELDGTLRLGRQGKAQFYGLIDDVAVYNKAMSPSELAQVMGAPISATHPNLLAGFTFDTYSGPLAAQPPGVATLNARAFSVGIAYPYSNGDHVLFDQPSLVSPSSVARRLPFPPGQIWHVNYEFDDRGGSHNGSSAFSWDFGRLDAPVTQDAVIAAAPGRLTYVNDAANGDGVVEVVPDLEADVYMHTAPGSWWDEFVVPGNYLLYPQPTQSITWLPVAQDQPLVKLYAPKNHLHRSVRHMGDGSEYTSSPSGPVTTTIPSAFDNYQRFREDLPQACTKTNSAHWAKNECWAPVLRGMPRAGQVIRRVQ